MKKIVPKRNSFAKILAGTRKIPDQLPVTRGEDLIVGESGYPVKEPETPERLLISPLQMLTNMKLPKIRNIELQDFGYDPTPKVRRDLNKNNILWDNSGSRAPIKIDFNPIDDGFLKEPDADSELPFPQLENSARVLNLTKELEKNFVFQRKYIKDRPTILHPAHSNREIRERMPTALDLFKPSKLGADDLKPNIDIRRPSTSIPSPL